MRVLVVGGGKVGLYVAQVLSDDYDVTIVDKSKDRCALVSGRLKPARVICEDGCEPWVLEMADVRSSDLVLAVTGDDEDNLVISYLSKFEYDVPKVIARVNNPRNRWLFTRSWGVDVEVSAPDIIATIILEEITLGEVVTVMKLQAGDIGLVEITLPADARALGKSLSELSLPPETLVVTVVRDEAMMIPRADTVLREGDRVLAITNINYREDLERLLGHTG